MFHSMHVQNITYILAEGPATMALREFGTGNPGALAYWDAVSKKYASNPYGLYKF